MTDLRDQLQTTLGDAYAIERELGGGGMSRVFLATERSLGRMVVIKVLPGDVAGAVSVERFNREISLAARLQQANIVPLLSAGDTNGLPFYTMPYVKGESLRARLASGGEFPVNEAVGILKEVARALAYAHEQGVVHRDIKPDNVLLSGGSAMVTDFGVAKALSVATSGDSGMTATGVALGTPAYMAPEQATADPGVDHRADIYAFGCLAYEMLTGTPPFVGRSAQAVIAAHMTESPEAVSRRRPSIPPSLADLITRCLEKRPADRPQRAVELVQALDDVVSGARTAATTTAPRAKTKLAVGVFAVLAVVVITTAAVMKFRGGGTGTGQPQSVAVLPFENAGGDAAQEYFSDGMTDDIASALVNDGMRVAPRTSAYFYKGKRALAKEVGTSLGVDAVLTGKVSRLGTRLRVSAELASAREGVTLWSYSGDRDAKDIFAVQHTITDSIVTALKGRLHGAAHESPRHENAQVLDLVWQGRHLADVGTPDAITQAVSLFHRALDIDPDNTSALVGLAYTLAESADALVPPIQVYPEALRAATRAIESDSTSAQAWSMRAALNLEYVWDSTSARRDMDRARLLNPNDPFIGFNESMYLIARGQSEQAIAPAVAASKLDPHNPLMGLVVLWTRLYTEQPDSAIAAAAAIDRIQPGWAYADGFGGYPLAQRKRFAEAESTFRAAEKVIGHRSPGLAWMYATQGRSAEARAVLTEIERDWSQKYVVPELLAWAYQALGEKERMYYWLEKGVEVHSGMAEFNAVWPPFRSLRSEPRFRAILRRLNIPDPTAS